jgi:alcohol dehydrogenase
MKAAQISDYGHAGVIHVVEVDKPTIQEGTVIVEVHASSINPWDTTVREGRVKEMIPLDLPATLGGDFSGVVLEAGADVTHLKAGDKVYGQAQVVSGNTGAFAEYARTKADEVALMPGNLTFAEAAAAPLTGLSALQVIVDRMHLQGGQKILIHGGAGGIGTIAIQIAKHLGAYVATTASGEGLDYVKNLGADEIIDYKSQQFEDVVHDYDAVFDTVAGETYERSFKALRPGGIIVSMIAQPNQGLMDQYKVTAIVQQTTTTVESLNALTKLIEEGVVTIHIDKTFPLEEITEAFEARESGSVKGKVAIQIRAD